MRKITTILLAFIGFISMSSYAQDMLITAVYDGPLSGGTPKGVELYVINDIPDASIYGLGSANNGGGSDGEEFTFPSTAFNAGDFIYVASEDVQFTAWFGFPPHYTTGAMSINGDDAIELFMNGGVIDVYGDINVDGTGEPWEYMDGWAYRVDGSGPDGSTFVLGNFTYSGPNALDGETSNATAANPVPIGTYTMSFVPDPEPSNYPTDFAGSGIGNMIELSWTDAIGAQLPSAYVIYITESTYVPPVDGTPVPDDLDLSDGVGAVNVNYGSETYTFTNLPTNTVYNFYIYPYTNGGATIDFKNDGTPPEVMEMTTSVLLYEDFDWSWMAWDTVNVIGDQVWDRDNSNGPDGSSCAYMNGWDGGAQDNEDWLISPRVDLTLGSNPYLSFYTAMNFSGPDLEIKWSSDYDGGGDPTTATWTDLTATLSPGGWAWTFSEPIDLSGIDTDIYVAFVYNSSGGAGSAAWQVDNVLITVDAYEPAGVVINEIMYNTPGNDEEWIELYNNTAEDIDVGGWFIQDNNSSNTPIAIPSGTVLSPDQYYTIKTSSDGNFPFTPDLDGTLQTNLYLNNGGDDVNLFSAGRLQADFVPYDDSSPWPTEPDGNGPSLSLLDPNLDNEMGENWAASLQDGGTPGWKNFPDDPTIIVTSPSGGEVWEQGSNYDITWDTVNYVGQVMIELVDIVSGTPTLVGSNVPSGALTFNWTIMTSQAPGDDYIIRITDMGGGPVGESPGTFEIIEAHVAPPLVITEIMYNPPESGNDSLEFIELYNNGTDPIDLDGFYFEAGVTHTFAPFVLNPSEYVVVGINAAAMDNTFGVTALEWTGGALSNSGELIHLVDAMGMFVDSVRYDDHTPWDTLADGFGSSLTLCDPSLDNGLAENWAASTEFAAINGAGDSIWATPMAGCSVISPTADFKAADTTVLVGGTADFTDMSTGGTMISWMWTFEGGDPATSTDQNPTGIMYATEGTYDVTLEVENDFGETSSLTKTDYISVGLAPVADFEADATNPSVGQEVNFTDLSTGTITGWAWTFEGGTPETSFLQTPGPITWALDGKYDVTLTVSNDYGDDTMLKEEYIDVEPIGIGEYINTDMINIYPNPASSILHVENTSGEEINLSIYNMTGQQVINKRITAGSTTLNVDHLDAGIYFIRYMTDSNLMNTGKLIIK